MTRAASPPLLADLQHPESLAVQVAALRTLKHEIIGHDQRKETWIGYGIVPLIARVLRRGCGKRTPVGELNGTRKQSDAVRTRTDEENACLQAIVIVCSLVKGGPPFITPILESDILPSMLSILSSPDRPQSLSLSILQTLDAIADRLPLQGQHSLRESSVADLLFSKEHIRCFIRLLGQMSTSHTTQSAITLTAGLIAKLCTEESQKVALADSGVLDVLAVRVASFVVAQGFVLPGAEDHLSEPGVLASFPPPAPRKARLAPILRAVAVIIEHSKSRAEHFLSSAGITTVFPKQLPEFSPTDIKKTPWGSTFLSGFAVPRQSSATPIDHVLPAVPLDQSKGNFPPLVSASFGKHAQRLNTPRTFLETPPSDDEENPIIPWLLFVVRSETGMTRLMAARLVTALFRLGLAKKHRVPMFSYLLLPLLLRMLDKDYGMTGETDPAFDGLIPTIVRMKEETPAILASLVMDTPELQKHAVEGGAIKKLSQLLKETYSPIQETSKQMWNADGNSRRPASRPGTQSELRLGPPAYSPIICHIMRYREGILKALAALAPFKDEYRKAICDNGVVPYIIDSLKPRPSEQPEDLSKSKNTVADGNPIPTLLAACGAARTLTRSVTALRTSLIDAGVTLPLVELIKHRDIEVQIAATSVICNLVLDFSPMREPVISSQILPILCEHAHSSNSKLRLESLWALKHVAYGPANDIKIKIIETLHPDWLKQIISQDHTLARRGVDRDLENGSSLMGMGSNSAGERVDLLNPMMEDFPDRDDDFKSVDSIPSSRVSLDMYLPPNGRRRKPAPSDDLDQTTQVQDDIAIQEQGFDLLRNTLCGTGAPEMIDYIFKEIGQNELLDILADKLRPRTIQVSNRRDSLQGKSVPIPPQILISVIYCMIHISAGLPRQKHLLAQHRDLLKCLMPYFNHVNHLVRVNCVWVVINLTCDDQPIDRPSCQERAIKLRNLGVMEQLIALENDSERDVRERTKTALHHMQSLLAV